MIITIGRQYGSMGRMIGKKLAETLGIPYYDKEILSLAAKNSGICEELIHEHDEKPNQSLLFSIVSNFRTGNDLSSLQVDLPLNHKIFLAQFDAIKKIAAEGSCVIVGRCADYVLRDNKNAIHIFVYADLETRVKNAAEYLQVDKKEAQRIVQKNDKERNNYYNYFSGRKWGESTHYDLCINTTHLDATTAADMIAHLVQYIDKK